MAATLRPYITCIRNTLNAGLCLQNSPCPLVERQNKPEIEYKSSPELILEPILLCRNEQEKCLIELSINSVRISVRFKQADQLEEFLTRKYVRFLMMRAEQLDILRRVPVEGYSCSFLITNSHLEAAPREELVDFVCSFIEDMYAEVSDLKLAVNSRGREVGRMFAQNLVSAT